MDSKRRYVMIFTDINKHLIINKSGEYRQVFEYLLMNATHQPYKTKFKGNERTLQRGELITGSKVIGDEFKIADSKILTILKYFEKQGLIKRETSNQNTLITINMYDYYIYNPNNANENILNENEKIPEPIPKIPEPNIPIIDNISNSYESKDLILLNENENILNENEENPYIQEDVILQEDIPLQKEKENPNKIENFGKVSSFSSNSNVWNKIKLSKNVKRFIAFYYGIFFECAVGSYPEKSQIKRFVNAFNLCEGQFLNEQLIKFMPRWLFDKKGMPLHDTSVTEENLDIFDFFSILNDYVENKSDEEKQEILDLCNEEPPF